LYDVGAAFFGGGAAPLRAATGFNFKIAASANNRRRTVASMSASQRAALRAS
jgi:hypothetical protein